MTPVRCHEARGEASSESEWAKLIAAAWWRGICRLKVATLRDFRDRAAPRDRLLISSLRQARNGSRGGRWGPRLTAKMSCAFWCLSTGTAPARKCAHRPRMSPALATW